MCDPRRPMGHSPQMHPERPVLGPEPLKDPRNFVPPLEPMYGPDAWDNASEVDPRSDCGRCGNGVRAHGIICGACERVHPDHQRKLTAERRNDPRREQKPAAKARADPRTKKAIAAEKAADKRAKRTARDQKRMADAYRAFRGNPEADAWAERVGLKVAG